MTALGPPEIVERPEPTGPATGSLLNHVPPTDPGNRWAVGGVTFELVCGAASRWAPCSGAIRTPTTPPPPPIFRPFQVVGAYQCATLGAAEDPGRYARNAERILQQHVSHQIENELWTGTLALANSYETPFLADGTATAVTTTAIPLTTAFARLVAGLRSCIGDTTGVIHVSPYIASILLRLAAIRHNTTGDRFETVFGDLVLAGGGYPGGGDATNTIYTFTSTATGGTFTLTVTDPQTGDSETTGNIAYNAAASTIRAALAALSIVDTADVTLNGGPLPTAVTVTFTGRYSGLNITMTAGTAALTGGTLTLTPTPGGSTPATDQLSAWMYATGPLATYLAPVEITPTETRETGLRTNTVMVIAERTALYTFDPCCHLAAQADLTSIDSGGGSTDGDLTLDGGGP